MRLRWALAKVQLRYALWRWYHQNVSMRWYTKDFSLRDDPPWLERYYAARRWLGVIEQQDRRCWDGMLRFCQTRRTWRMATGPEGRLP